jgi:two-component system, OmpR family, sensor histidine kinase MprB
MTLRTRIAAAAGLSVALTVLAAAIGLYVGVRSDLRGEVDKGLRARASAFTRSLPGGGPAGAEGGAGAEGQGPPGLFGEGAQPPTALPSSVQPAPFGGASGYVQFVASSGSVRVPGGQGSSSTQIPLSATDRAIAREGKGSVLSDRTVHGTKLRVLTEGLGARGAVMVARPLTEVDSELSRLVTILAIVGAAGIALAAGLGALVSRFALEPIRRFTARTETLTEQGTLRGESLDLSRRLQVEGHDELGRLADSFNRTLDALERSISAQRQLVADAGHELRTPIASLRANIQVLGEAQRLPTAEQESLRQDIVDELDELTALVADVIELARGTMPESGEDEVRLDSLIAMAVEKARRRGLRASTRLEPTVVTGAADRIERAVVNLLDNARKWSPDGEMVEIELQDGVLSVRDRGPGFDPDDVEHVFDRFYRSERARRLPGSGLGLAIVRQAAEACGGWAQAENAPGGGALLRVSFGPRAAFTAAHGAVPALRDPVMPG